LRGVHLQGSDLSGANLKSNAGPHDSCSLYLLTPQHRGVTIHDANAITSTETVVIIAMILQGGLLASPEFDSADREVARVLSAASTLMFFDLMFVGIFAEEN
jgi:hypothetical protein